VNKYILNGVLVVIGMGICMIMTTYSDKWKRGPEAIKLIKLCESELPRNKHCKIIAVPEK